jgi:uncharacterized membrane protein
MRSTANEPLVAANPAPRRRSLRRAALVLAARPRLLGSLAFGLAVYLLAPLLFPLHAATRVLIAWNGGAWLYLALVWRMARHCDAVRIRRRALQQDDGRKVLLGLSVAAALAVLLAVASQLAVVKDLSGTVRLAHMALAALTVVTSWCFTQTIFALHYAHEFHAARLRGEPDPLSFPGTAEPLYRDFLYFACVIGTSGQTADVAFNGSALRGVGAVHCVLAYFFNATVLALAINIAAGLF